jgi:pyruvate dehydrogenase E1 component alpha subunit
MLVLDLYKRIALIRYSEIAIQRIYAENDMKTPMHMSMGEESAVVGVVSALEGAAQFFGYYRSHALFLAVSQDVDSFFAELYGKDTGASRGRAGSMHMAYPDKNLLLVSAIVSSTVAPAVGAAFANKYRGNAEIAVSFFGDGAIEEGVFWESLNIACLFQLPILFVCLDNGLAVDSPAINRQGFKSIREVIQGFKVSYFHDESSDPLVINKLANEAKESIRIKKMPTFLHLNYYRALQHIGIKNDFENLGQSDNLLNFERAGYRSMHERDEWMQKDPLVIAEKLIEATGLKKNEIEITSQSIKSLVEVAISRAKSAKYSHLDELTKWAYST